MPKLPLEGVRVVDLTVVWAGPYCAYLLASMGAEVIRIESTRFFAPLTRGMRARPTEEQVRAGLPIWAWGMPDRQVGERPWNRVPMFNAHAVNKRSVTMNVDTPRGKELLGRLVAISDLVVENNVTETMEKLGITYSWLKAQREEIIFIRMPAFGNTGAYRNYRALGSMNESVAGHNTLRGYPDMDPSSITAVYTADAAAGAGAAFAALAALRHRRRSGKGQLIEVAQIENFLPYLSQALMDYTMNGRVAGTLGNRHPFGIQGCYPCKDDGSTEGGRWVALSIFDDDQFQRFARAVGRPEWALDERFADVISRYRHHDELDRLIEEWTQEHTPYDAFHLLQRAGVPAGPVMDQRDALTDPHLQARGFFQEAFQEDVGTLQYPRGPFTMSETPPGVRRGPVRLGEDNEYVYKELLRLSDAEYQALVQEGMIGTEYAPEVP